MNNVLLHKIECYINLIEHSRKGATCPMQLVVVVEHITAESYAVYRLDLHAKFNLVCLHLKHIQS